MVRKISESTRIPVPGGKVINEYIGRVNSGDETVSIAHMVAPPGWAEPAQTPEFTEYTLVLKGSVVVEHEGGTTVVSAGRRLSPNRGKRFGTARGPMAPSTSPSACPRSPRRPRTGMNDGVAAKIAG